MLCELFEFFPFFITSDRYLFAFLLYFLLFIISIFIYIEDDEAQLVAGRKPAGSSNILFSLFFYLVIIFGKYYNFKASKKLYEQNAGFWCVSCVFVFLVKVGGMRIVQHKPATHKGSPTTADLEDVTGLTVIWNLIHNILNWNFFQPLISK